MSKIGRAEKRTAGSEPAPVCRPAEGEVQLGLLNGFIGFHLRLAQEASFRAFAQRVGDPDLKPRRFAILNLIHENPGLTQTALGRASGRDKSTLTPALNDLERRGLITRERSASDRRSYVLSLTREGKALLQKLARHAEAHDRRLDEVVGLDKKAEFVRTLRKIAMALG
jgi:DNA-binding MarR family transcriptional regulator